MSFSDNLQPDDRDQPGVLKGLPRRKTLDISEGSIPISQMRFQEHKYNRFTAIRRLFVWVSLGFSFLISILFNILRRRDSPEMRSRDLRRAFEKRGGPFVKLGLHLSMRVDLLPWAYSVELSKMIDRMEPFPVNIAIKQIERSVKTPITAVFSRFDPEPIQSTSTACVYQARFHNKERAIVKVRRPGIESGFMADLQAFEWLLKFAELLTIFKPGFTDRIYQDYRAYLLEELDFDQEARRQDIFRRAAADLPKQFFSAPKVYLGLSNEEVVIEEFISGMWLDELLEAIHHKNEGLLERARSLNIRPKKVADRLMWVHYWSIGENLFFIADPHPSQIIIGHDSKLYFMNFSNTGALSRSNRQAFQQNQYYIEKKDPLNMARASLVLLEPLPPVDLMELTAELESYNWKYLYSLDASPRSLTWPERTSVAQWFGMIKLANKHSVVIDRQVLLLLKSALITESTAVRLNHGIDILKVYRKYERFRAEQARRRVTDSVINQMEGEVNERLIISLDRIAYSMQGLFFQARHSLALPSVNFSTLMGKWSYALYALFRLGFQIILITGAAILFIFGIDFASVLSSTAPEVILQTAFSNPIYQLLLLILIFTNGKSILFRLDDIEVK